MRHVLISLVVVATVHWGGGCSPAQQAEGPPTATPTAITPADAPPTPTEPPTPTPTAPDRDDVAVMVDADGRVVVIDATTGDEVRELLDGVRVDDPASNDIAMTPDRAAVFVVVPPDEPPGTSDIVRVPVDGGQQETVAQGTVPAVSPDGQTLAYVTYEQDGPGHPEPLVVVQELDSGAETRLARDDPFVFIPDVEWSADGTRVVFTAGEIHTGLHAVAADADSLDQARRLGPDLDENPRRTSWGPVAALDEGRLAVVEACCDLPREDRWHIVEVDATDGTVAGSLIPDERIEATHLDSEAESGDLLMVLRGGPDGGALVRWDGEGEPEQITDGVIVAAW